MTILRLDEKAIAGSDIKIDIRQQFADEDLSGSSSATDSAETGAKAKEITVNLKVPFAKKERLTEISRYSEALDKKGSRKIYRIGHDASNAVGINQVRFFGELRISETTSGGLNAWVVSFNLKEVLSVPERTENRQSLPAARQQSHTQAPWSTESSKNDNVPPNTDAPTIENFLAKLDDDSSSFMRDPSESIT